MLTLGNKIIAGSFKSGASWEVGDVGISALGIDEALNKRRYLNGQVISQAQFVQFTAFLKSRVSVYPSLATTEVNWQAEVTNSKLGQCGKFVIDDTAGTIRLPKVVNINGLQDLTVLGGIKAESLPNIKGTFDTGDRRTHILGTSGALYKNTIGSGSWGGTSTASGNTQGVGFDASLSSSTYQDDAPVQQEAVQYPYFIQVAEGIENSVDVSREIELNNPFSLLDYKYSEYKLSNASWLLSNGQWNSGAVYQSVYDLLLQIYNGTVTKAGVSVKLSTETYADTDFVLNTSDTTFRLPLYTQRVLVKKYKNGQNTYNLYSDGWCEQSGSVQIPGPGGAVVSLNIPYADLEYEILSTPAQNIAEPPCVTNRTLTSIELDTTNGNTSPWVYWHTAGYANPPSVSDYTEIKGLYFYVGETMQDASIIAAGQALTDIADLKAHSIVETYVNGTSWYRVYSDGWCEQGGKSNQNAGSTHTINLLKSFKNTDYCVLATIAHQIPNQSYDGFSITIINASSFKLFTGQNTGNGLVDWQACGYIS
jgi:hypothetical protein